MKKYIAHQKELIDLEYELESKEKQKPENEITNIDLCFILRSKTLPGDSKKSRNWTTTLPLPKNLISPEYLLTTDPTYVNISDKITIEFLNSEKKAIKGTVKQIRGGELTAIFELDWEEDSARHKCSIKFSPDDTVYKRKLNALKKLNRLNNDLKDMLCRKYPTNQKIPNIELNLPSNYNFNESQKKAIRMAVSNSFSLIQGPPGTGKTHTIGAIAIQALHNYPNKKVLVCGTTNVSISSLLEIVGDMVQEAGFKVCWPAAASRDFSIEENLTKEQKLMTLYQCQNMNTSDNKRFRELRNKHEISEQENREMKYLRNKLEDKIIRESNVVFSTLDSSGKNSIVNNIGDISVLIVDEATLSVESSMIIPLSLLPERFVLVGDQKQLGPQSSFEQLRVKGYYYSMFERIIKEKSCLKNSVMLNTQYRMHPDISCLPNELFYDNELIDGVNENDRQIEKNFKFRKHLNFINCNGEEEKNGTSYINSEEINYVDKFVNALVDYGIQPSQIGVISAYGAQTQVLSDHFKNHGPRVKVSTIDSFQGSQKDYIIICTTRNGTDLGFLKDRRRMNVAITRARRMVTIFGNEATLSQCEFWNNVIEYTKKQQSFYEKLPDIFNKQQRHKPIIISKNKDNLVQELVSEFKEEPNEAGYNLNEIESKISDSMVRILWPDEKNDLLFLEEWVQKRINVLNSNNKHVTLAYDAEGVCMQFGDIFDEMVDYYNWEPGMNIPEIKTNESIIISFYEHKGDHKQNPILVNIMKPLLEHPRITFITFDFTFDFDRFIDFDIDIKTNQVIDVQLMILPENNGLNESEDFVCSTGWKSISNFIRQVNEDNDNSRIIYRAKESVKNGKKDFPHEENNFLINQFNYPRICQFTNIFLEYSAGDIFYTAIVGIDVLSRGQLDEVKERSLRKLNTYKEYRKKYSHVQNVRQAYYVRESFSSVIQAQFSKDTKLKQILTYHKKLSSFVMLLDNCPELLQKIIPSFTDEDDSNIRQRYKDIVEIMKNPENPFIGIIKDNAILSYVHGIQKKAAFVLRVKDDEIDEVKEDIKYENKIAQEKIEKENEEINKITGGKNSFKKKSDFSVWSTIDMSKPMVIKASENKFTSPQTAIKSQTRSPINSQNNFNSKRKNHKGKSYKNTEIIKTQTKNENSMKTKKSSNAAWSNFTKSQLNKTNNAIKPAPPPPANIKQQSTRPVKTQNELNKTKPEQEISMSIKKPVNSAWSNFTQSQLNHSSNDIKPVPPPKRIIPASNQQVNPGKSSKQQNQIISSSFKNDSRTKQINSSENNIQIDSIKDIITC